ncbi:MAG TPA: hypothetical protein VF540_07235, partial [Segetibacter sp.]
HRCVTHFYRKFLFGFFTLAAEEHLSRMNNIFVLTHNRKSLAIISWQCLFSLPKENGTFTGR